MDLIQGFHIELHPQFFVFYFFNFETGFTNSLSCSGWIWIYYQLDSLLQVGYLNCSKFLKKQNFANLIVHFPRYYEDCIVYSKYVLVQLK